MYWSKYLTLCPFIFQSNLRLQESIEDGSAMPTTPSVCSLKVEDSMFGALRKTSISGSNLTVENNPSQTDSEDASSLASEPSNESDTKTKSNIRIHNNRRQSDNSPKPPLPPVARAKQSLRRKGVVERANLVTERLGLEQDSKSTPIFHDNPSYQSDLKVVNVNNMNMASSNDDSINKIDKNNDENGANSSVSVSKKDSACYTISDVGSEPDLRVVDGSLKYTQRTKPKSKRHKSNSKTGSQTLEKQSSSSASFSNKQLKSPSPSVHAQTPSSNHSDKKDTKTTKAQKQWTIPTIEIT